MKNLKVGNLKLSGIFNRHPLDELLQHPKVELKNNYKELNVNNMVVDGLVDGHNISELWNTMGQIHENLEFEGEKTCCYATAITCRREQEQFSTR